VREQNKIVIFFNRQTGISSGWLRESDYVPGGAASQAGS
jgi:hypothetical protein